MSTHENTTGNAKWSLYDASSGMVKGEDGECAVVSRDLFYRLNAKSPDDLTDGLLDGLADSVVSLTDTADAEDSGNLLARVKTALATLRDRKEWPDRQTSEHFGFGDWKLHLNVDVAFAA